jgi:hypothetical protein
VQGSNVIFITLCTQFPQIRVDLDPWETDLSLSQVRFPGPPGPPGPPAPLWPLPDDPFVFQKKIKWDLVPTWDGNGKTAVTWVTEVENFARFSPQAAVELGIVTPTRFTGRLSMTWNLLSNNTCAVISASWLTLSQWIIASYLGNHWRVNEVTHFESMKFRQAGQNSLRLCAMSTIPLSNGYESNSQQPGRADYHYEELSSRMAAFRTMDGRAKH